MFKQNVCIEYANFVLSTNNFCWYRVLPHMMLGSVFILSYGCSFLDSNYVSLLNSFATVSTFSTLNCTFVAAEVVVRKLDSFACLLLRMNLRGREQDVGVCSYYGKLETANCSSCKKS